VAFFLMEGLRPFLPLGYFSLWLAQLKKAINVQSLSFFEEVSFSQGEGFIFLFPFPFEGNLFFLKFC